MVVYGNRIISDEDETIERETDYHNIRMYQQSDTKKRLKDFCSANANLDDHHYLDGHVEGSKEKNFEKLGLRQDIDDSLKNNLIKASDILYDWDKSYVALVRQQNK